MNAQKIAMYVMCFILSGGIINGLGIFEPVLVPNATMPSADLAEGIKEVDDVTTADAIADAFEGGAMVLGMTKTLLSVFAFLALPGYYLYTIGFPLSIALAIQTICSVIEIIAVLQFISNRSLKGME